jgi:hypothetical protein
MKTCDKPTDELSRLAAEGTLVGVAKDALERLSRDPEVVRLVHERKTVLKLRLFEEEETRRLGIEWGQLTALRGRLRWHLTKRFGSLPDWAEQGLATARIEELERADEAAFDASSVEEALDVVRPTGARQGNARQDNARQGDDPVLRAAREEIGRLERDPETCRDRRRIDSHKLDYMGLLARRQRGEAEGKWDALYRSVRRRLTKRFGPLPDWAERRLRAATPEELERADEAAFDGSSRDQAFAFVCVEANRRDGRRCLDNHASASVCKAPTAHGPASSPGDGPAQS